MATQQGQSTGEWPRTEPAGNGPRWTENIWPPRGAWAVAVIILTAAGALLLAHWLTPRANRPLFPQFPTPTLPAQIIENEAAQVTFSELNEDPAAFLNRRLTVSGEYSPVVPPDCPRHSGPDIRWSLVSEGLRLNAVGFESLVRLLPPGTEMTVEGIWQLYEGPLGCGKAPPEGTVWYLRVERIIAPNPLFSGNRPLITVIAEPTQAIFPEVVGTPELEQPTATATITTTLVITATETPTITPTLFLTPTLDFVTPTATGTPEILTTTPTETPTLTATSTTTPDGTPTIGGTETPPLPTATQNATGYPSPTSPSGYP